MSGSYSPTSWVDGTTKLGPTNLNKLEDGTRDAYTQAHGIFNVKDVAYGAVGDGVTDDTTAIQAAINAAGAAGGGTVWLPQGTYKLSSTLTIGDATGGANSTYNGVVLVGEGSGGTLDGLGSPTTKLAWAGSAAGTVVKINGPIAGWGIRGIQIDGGAGAAIGLQVVSGQFGSVSDLTVTASNDAIQTTTTAGGHHNTMHNHWDGVFAYVQAAANSHAINIGGNADNLTNTCYDLFDNVYIVFLATVNTTYGIYLKETDNVRFRSLHFANSAGRNAVTFDYSDASGSPIDTVIERVDFGSATAVVSNIGSPGSGFLNRIFGISRDNGRISDPALAGLEFGDEVSGTATLTWPGGNQVGNGVFVAHGLGAIPRTVFALPIVSSGLSVVPAIECLSSFNDSTQIALRATTIDGTSPANTATVTVAWTARG